MHSMHICLTLNVKMDAVSNSKIRMDNNKSKQFIMDVPRCNKIKQCSRTRLVILK